MIWNCGGFQHQSGELSHETTKEHTFPIAKSSPLNMNGWKMLEDYDPIGARPFFRWLLLLVFEGRYKLQGKQRYGMRMAPLTILTEGVVSLYI